MSKPQLQSDTSLLEDIRLFYTSFKSEHYLGTNRWFYGKFLDVYVKNYFRHLQGEFSRSFEIANVSVHAPYQKQGIYSDLLDFCFTLIEPGQIVFVENVLNPYQESLYVRRGFKKYNLHGEDVSSFYRIKYDTDDTCSGYS